MRSTTIETFDKTDVIVPNADPERGHRQLTGPAATPSAGRVTVGWLWHRHPPGDRILGEIAWAQPDVAKYPEPGDRFLGFGADSLDFRMRMILRDVNKMLTVKNEVHHQIAERFKARRHRDPLCAARHLAAQPRGRCACRRAEPVAPAEPAEPVAPDAAPAPAGAPDQAEADFLQEAPSDKDRPA